MEPDTDKFDEDSNIVQDFPTNPPSPRCGEMSPNLFANRHPIAARAVLLAAVVLFLFFALLLVALHRQPDTRNVPELLFAHISSSNAPKLPELVSLKTNLSPEELAFGRQQIAQMVKDRPELGRSVYATDPIWQFCVRSFAGEAIGEPIVWNDSLPMGDTYAADHQGPWQGQKGYIRLRKVFASGADKGRPLSCEELWSGVVFEIENMRNYGAFDALYYRALAGQLTREEFILANTRLEYDALRRSAQDYLRVWRPLARFRGLSDTPYLWGVGAPRTYEDWISLYRDPKGYPWDSFGSYYDQELGPYLTRIGIQRKVSR